MDRMERVKLHVVEGENGCWLWTGALDGETPIVRLSQPRRITPARRHAYQIHNELTVPPSHTIRNTCGDSKCICPWHSSAVKRGHQLNGKFGFNPPRYCKRGHEWTEWNTFRVPGQIMCRACHKMRNRATAANSKERMASAQKRLVRRKLDAVNALKGVCVTCGETHPAVLDFHHRDSGDKDLPIAVAVRKWPLNRVLDEIKKCDVLCSNCHRKLHWEQRRKANSLALEKEVQEHGAA